MKISLLGFVANIFGLLTFVLAVYAALAVFSLSFTLVEGLAQIQPSNALPQSPSALALIGQSLVASGRNALTGMWELRAGFVAFGLLGVFAAWSHRLGLLVDAERAWWISFVCVALFSIVLSITWLFAQRQQIALWIAESPEVYRWRDLLLGSQTVELTVGPIFALTVSIPVWAMWRWWYMRLMALWLPAALARSGEETRGPETAPGQLGASAHRSYAERVHALKRGAPPPATATAAANAAQTVARGAGLSQLLENTWLYLALAMGAALCIALYLWANAYHQRTALRFEHGMAFVDSATQPEVAFPVQIEADIQRLRVVNINGLGVVDLVLSPSERPADPVATVPNWQFVWRSDDYLYQDLPIANLAPGDYVLRFEQDSGWGYFEYMVSHGGGPNDNLSALATGFFLACSLLLTGALLALVAGRVWTFIQ